MGLNIDHPLFSASTFFSTSFAAEYYVLAALGGFKLVPCLCIGILIILLTVYIRIALVIYDWLINLDDEIRCFWAFQEGRRKLKAGTVLYALSRYPPIVQLVLSVRTDMPMSSTVCSRCLVPSLAFPEISVRRT